MAQTGRARFVDLNTLERGVYFINYDNKTGEFIKR